MNAQAAIAEIMASSLTTEAKTAAIMALVAMDAPAKATDAPKARASKAPAKKAVSLTRSTRSAFVKAAPWAEGLSTRVIAAMCVEDPTLVPAGFAIGAGYTALVS
jgi:hypothetical protein